MSNGDENAAEAGAEEAPEETPEVNGDPKVRVKNIFDQLLEAMENALDLRVMTVVTDFQIKDFDSNDKSVTIELEGDQKGLVTSINILTGDVKNIIHNDYTGAQNKETRELHQQNVELAREIVANNLKMLGDLIEKFGGYLQSRGDED